MVQLVLLRPFFLVTASTPLLVRPMSCNLFGTEPPSTTSFLVTLSVLVCPRLMCLSSQQSLDRFQPHPFLQLFTIVLCCPSLPIPSWLVSKASFYGLWVMSTATCPSEQKQGVPLWLLDPEINLPSKHLSAQASVGMVRRSPSNSRQIGRLKSNSNWLKSR